MSLKEYGWETYRLRSHSSSTMLTHTDTQHTPTRKLPKGQPLPVSPQRQLLMQASNGSSILKSPTEQTSRQDLHTPLSIDVSSPVSSVNHGDSMIGDSKHGRSSTLPGNILVNPTDKSDVRKGKHIFESLEYVL